jgi:hypothetical protein
VKRRSVLVAAGWLGAVVLAVLAGLGAINVIGAGLTSSGNQPRTAAEVRRELANLPATETPTETPSTTPTTKTPRTDKSFSTRGGTVVGSCDAGTATIRSMSPASGFAVHERNGAEGEFRSTSDNHDRVRFTITCAGDGTPVLAGRGGGSDD